VENNKKKAIKRIKQMSRRKVYADLVDYEYLSKLSPEEAEFLADFTEEYYGSASHSTNPKILTPDEVRAGWRNTKKRLLENKYNIVELDEFITSDEMNPEELLIWKEQNSIRLIKEDE
jgi:hypothetical protein